MYRARIIPKQDIQVDAQKILGNRYSSEQDVYKRIEMLSDLKIYGYNEKNSGMPPCEITENGRLNPKYIPYFYVAEEAYTAIAECKPYQFDNVSVAMYRTISDIKITSFNKYITEPKDESDFLMHHLFYIFSRPVKNKDKEYILPQYIAEYIKHLGFDGICYCSSLDIQGKNITLFNSDKCKFENSYVYKIKDISFEVEPETTNRQAPKIYKKKHTI